MWHVADAVQGALEFLDLILHWRVYLPTLAGLAFALLMRSFFPEHVGSWAIIVFPGVGLVVGLLWEWAR